MKPGEYESKIVPRLKDLNQIYGIVPPICMQILRPILHAKLVVSFYRRTFRSSDNSDN